MAELRKKKTTATNSGIDEAPIVDETYESQKDYKEDFVDSTSIFGGAKRISFPKTLKAVI